MTETCKSHLIGKCLNRRRFVPHRGRKIEPAETISYPFRIGIPDRMVAVPNALDYFIGVQSLQGVRDELGVSAKMHGHPTLASVERKGFQVSPCL